MRVLAGIITCIALLGIGYQLKGLSSRYIGQSTKLEMIKTNMAMLEMENRKLEEDIKYYTNPDNLEKEARTRLNFKKPGEELIIIVPRQ